MNSQVDFERLCLAHHSVREELLSERTRDGRWVGEVAGSPLATAAAIGALVIAHRRVELSCCGVGGVANTPLSSRFLNDADESELSLEAIVAGPLSELVVGGLHGLARAQNKDGGWGDCDGAPSNLAATALVMAAFRLTGVPAKYIDLIARGEQFMAAQGGLDKLRQPRGGDRLWAARLAACAVAEMIPWRRVPTVPFEKLCELPFGQWLSITPMDDLGNTPAVQIATGRSKYQHAPPRNPLTRLLRRTCLEKSLDILERSQADDGSFLASPLWTALVVLSLADSGLRDHPVVQQGVEFLLSSVRADVSWPVVTNLAIRNTAEAICALISEPQVFSKRSGGDSATLNAPHFHLGDARPEGDLDAALLAESVNWLLACQEDSDRRPTRIAPGGWSWSDAPSAATNVADTAVVLFSLARSWERVEGVQRPLIERASIRGVEWLMEQQLGQGGWAIDAFDADILERGTIAPTTDATAGAVCALAAWLRIWSDSGTTANSARKGAAFQSRVDRMRLAAERAMAWLSVEQQSDGSFAAASFGDESQTDCRNRIYGTCRVLTACLASGQLQTPMAKQAANWLERAQTVAGGWGPPRASIDYSGTYAVGMPAGRTSDANSRGCNVEETAWAVAALMPFAGQGAPFMPAVTRGLNWLIDAVEKDLLIRPAAIGVWQGKFWYYERLNPQLAAAIAFSAAQQQLALPAGGVALRV